jgi:hypothetical protein
MCVFCGILLSNSFGEAPALLPPPPGLNRSALYTYRARAIAASTAALLTASCGGAVTSGPEDASIGTEDVANEGNFGAEAAYGGPYDGGFDDDERGFDDSSEPDAQADVIRTEPPYGAPPPPPRDAEPPEASTPDVGFAPPYGLPIPTYGVPPP